MSVPDDKRLNELEVENLPLKKLLAEPLLEIAITSDSLVRFLFLINFNEIYVDILKDS